MSKLTQNPEIDQLLERIAVLEHKTAVLQARLDDLGQALLNSLEEGLRRYNEFIEAIQETNEFLAPVFAKVFPKYADTQAQVDVILDRRSPGDKKKDG
jgi:hemoglobin-like flavoprotein